MRRNDIPQNDQKRQKMSAGYFLAAPPLEQGGHFLSPK
jgi:hypothetical protein